MAYYNPLYNWVVFHPLYNPTNQVPFFHGLSSQDSTDY